MARTPGLTHKSDCGINDATFDEFAHDYDCTCGAVLAHRESIIEDCQSIMSDYLPPDGIDAQTALNRLLAILDGPRGLAAAGIVKTPE